MTKPFHTFRDGTIKATIWRNSTDDGKAFYSVEIVRGYKDQNDQWQDSTSFTGNELLRVAELARDAYRFIRDQRAVDAKSTSEAPQAPQSAETHHEIPIT